MTFIILRLIIKIFEEKFFFVLKKKNFLTSFAILSAYNLQIIYNISQFLKNFNLQLPLLLHEERMAVIFFPISQVYLVYFLSKQILLLLKLFRQKINYDYLY